MAITPQTVLRLVKVPLEIDNKNQLTFENTEKQASYFLSLPYKEITEISFQRKDKLLYHTYLLVAVLMCLFEIDDHTYQRI